MRWRKSRVSGAPQPRWSFLPDDCVERYNEVLLGTDAPYTQYPFWTEPYRSLGIRPVHLVYRGDASDLAYVCVQSVGVPGFRIGVICGGPVSLDGSKETEIESLQSLASWARREGYFVLKMTGDRIDRIGRPPVPGIRPGDPFPFYGSGSHEGLSVDLEREEDTLLASFQPIARREIRAAREAGYEIRASSRPEDFARFWPMIEDLAARKGFRIYRPLTGWLDMIERAQSTRTARVYWAEIGQDVVQVALVVRDADSAEYMLGALDVDRLGRNPSPACLLHFRAMTDMRRSGCRVYELGPPSGPVMQFKRKFRPARHVSSEPIHIITGAVRYRLWSGLLLPIARDQWPRFRRALADRLSSRADPGGG